MQRLDNLQAFLYQCVLLCALCSLPGPAVSNTLEDWLQHELQPSSLTLEQQRAELQWFQQAARPFRGMSIRVTSEKIKTHWYEATVLARIFSELTGIQVVHEITAEDDVVKKLKAQLELGYSLYDMYITDSDLLGTLYRSGEAVSLTQFMAQAGREVTLPTLDLEDFIGLSLTTGPDGELYQLPDQQFANLYWYRHDWFSRPALRKAFFERYGYALGVPANWSAYEDIAEFFTEHVKTLDGQRVYGHMDYGKLDPSLGWRFSDAWLSMAGAGDPGLPNGTPVDEWGIRIAGCHPRGASVGRGGALNSPAAKYALRKYVEWLQRFAPPAAQNMTFSEAGAVPAQGNIAQQIFWYTAFTASMTQPNLPITEADGTPKWRMAPSPVGAYWQPGMKRGYQDAGAWTMLRSTPLPRRQAAWLYAQFVVSKTVSLKKTLVGLTPIRTSDIQSSALSQVAYKYGGLVEFYRSPGQHLWTSTGFNVPDYPALADLWWRHAGAAAQGQVSPELAMDNLAAAMDQRLLALQARGQTHCAPIMNPLQPNDVWLLRPGSPKIKLLNEKPVPLTLDHQHAVETWH